MAMMNYVIGNLVTVDTLDSVSGEDGSGFYDKENLYNKCQSKPLRFNAKSDCYGLVDLGSDTQVKFSGIINHNLESPTVFKIKAYLQATGKPANAAAAADWEDDFAVVSKCPNSFLSFDKTYRYWLFHITEAALANYPEVGEFILQSSIGSFTRNFVVPYTEIRKYIKTQHVTHYQQKWRTQVAKLAAFKLDFKGATDANLISEIEDMFDDIGADPFVFIPNDDETYSWYAEIMNDLEAQQQFVNYNDFSIQLEEQARGITLL